jgi:hypothetical protein
LRSSTIAGIAGITFNIGISSNKKSFHTSKQPERDRLSPLPYPALSISNHPTTTMQIEYAESASTNPSLQIFPHNTTFMPAVQHLPSVHGRSPTAIQMKEASPSNSHRLSNFSDIALKFQWPVSSVREKTAYYSITPIGHDIQRASVGIGTTKSMTRAKMKNAKRFFH